MKTKVEFVRFVRFLAHKKQRDICQISFCLSPFLPLQAPGQPLQHMASPFWIRLFTALWVSELIPGFVSKWLLPSTSPLIFIDPNVRTYCIYLSYCHVLLKEISETMISSVWQHICSGTLFFGWILSFSRDYFITLHFQQIGLTFIFLCSVVNEN